MRETIAPAYQAALDHASALADDLDIESEWDFYSTPAEFRFWPAAWARCLSFDSGYAGLVRRDLARFRQWRLQLPADLSNKPLRLVAEDHDEEGDPDEEFQVRATFVFPALQTPEIVGWFDDPSFDVYRTNPELRTQTARRCVRIGWQMFAVGLWNEFRVGKGARLAGDTTP